jgi:flavodoxin
MLNALVIYFSPGGNTKRVAEAFARGLEHGEADVTLLPLAEAQDIDYAPYDLVCLGAPSYHFNVPEPVLHYIKKRLSKAEVRLGAPLQPHKWAAVLVTYGGPHTGIDEATPAGDHMAQMFRHLGYEVRGIWYTVGAFHGDHAADNNLYGWLGDIRGRPNEHDLGAIESNAAGLAFVLDHLKSARHKVEPRQP